jgi:hypothetical protein
MHRGTKALDSSLDELRQTGSLEEVFARTTAGDAVGAAEGSAA